MCDSTLYNIPLHGSDGMHKQMRDSTLCNISLHASNLVVEKSPNPGGTPTLPNPHPPLGASPPPLMKIKDSHRESPRQVTRTKSSSLYLFQYCRTHDVVCARSFILPRTFCGVCLIIRDRCCDPKNYNRSVGFVMHRREQRMLSIF